MEPESPKVILTPQPLTRAAFAGFGDVIETDGAQHFPINAGAIERYHDLATVSIDTEQGGLPVISIMAANKTTEWPAPVKLVERHSKGSQAFFPLYEKPMFVVVADASKETIEPKDLRAFFTNGRQGVNYHPGTWHMPLLASDLNQQVLIIDRDGPGDNCDEFHFEGIDIFVDRGE